MTEQGFAYCRTGTCGCEVVSPDGQVFAWTVDAEWAGLIVGLLNWVEQNAFSRPAPAHPDDGEQGPVENRSDSFNK